METLLLPINGESVDKAADLLKSGEIVAIPTETVYGLAGNGLNSQAVKKIFFAKGRPQDNPLILHICDLEMLNEIATDIPSLGLKLAEAFWPGSLTMIFKKSSIVPTEQTAVWILLPCECPKTLTHLTLSASADFLLRRRRQIYRACPARPPHSTFSAT